VAALDLGDVYTGVALSDAGRSLATPLEVVRSESIGEYLAALVRDEAVTEVVVGVPKTMKGEIGFQARRILDTLSDLKSRMPEVEFVEWDERLTTRMAASPGDRKRGRGEKKAKRMGGRVDHLAAAQMLQEYLKFRESV
jgi:putative Holliday junction resolvase